MFKEKFSEQQKIEAVQKYIGGKSASAVGRYFGVSEGLIARILKSHNIQIRKNNSPAILDDNIIKLYNEGKSIKYIKLLYKSSDGRIEKFLFDNNIALRDYKCPRSDIWKPDKELANKIIDNYNSGVSALQLGIIYGVADVTITDFLKRNNINIRKHPDANRNRYGYGLNENVFNEINEESAYWIGFILSDGNIYKGNKDSNSINFGLKESDWEHLEKLKKFFGCTKPLYYNNKSVFISFYSKKIQDKLAEFGIIPRKSKIAKVPEILKNNSHFWRGMVDGDGWVTTSNGYPCIGLCGTFNIVNNFNNFVKMNNKICHPKKENNFYSVQYTGKRAYEIATLLYEESNIYLNRKAHMYAEFCFM